MSSADPPRVDNAGPLAASWSNVFGQASAQGEAIMAFWGAFADPQTLRNHWLESMTGAMDGYLRSPAFMKSMQTSLKTATDVKAASDELVRNFARDAGILLASDIEDLSRRLDQVEHVISTRLEAIEARLMQIESGPGTPSGARQSA